MILRARGASEGWYEGGRYVGELARLKNTLKETEERDRE